MRLTVEQTLDSEEDRVDINRRTNGSIRREHGNNKLALNMIMCIGCAAGLLFIVSTIGCIYVYMNLERYKYDTEEMAKHQPLMLKKVKAIIEISQMNESSAVQMLRDMTTVENKTCFTTPCLQSALSLLESMDMSVDPCQDFYTFSCGNWITKNPYANSSISSDQFNTINDKVTKVTKAILKSPSVKADSRALGYAKTFFANCVNEEQLESVGLKPLLDILQMHGGWPIFDLGYWNPKWFNWIKTTAELQRVSNPSIIGVDIKQNIAQATSSVIFLTQPSLFLSREYLVDPKKHSRHIGAYKDLILKCAKELGKEIKLNEGRNDTSNQTDFTEEELKYYDKVADEIIRFESEIAKISFDEDNRFNQHKPYFKLYILQEDTDSYTNENSTTKIDWKRFLDRVFTSSGVHVEFDESVIVQESDYFTSLAKLLNYTTDETLANYLLWRLVAKFATGTTAAMRQFIFEYNQKIYGVRGSPIRETTCTSLVNEKFGTVVGMEYIQGNFDSSIRREVHAIAEALKVATEDLLENSKMLPEYLKNAVSRKLMSLKNCIGFPEALSNRTAVKEFYSDLTLDEETYIENYIHISNWMFDKTLKRLRKPFDSDCWGGNYWTFIGEAYAYYDTARNSINFPVGILQPPFYRRGAPTFLNFGGIGAIIGHEITHSLNLEGWIKMEIANDLAILEQCLIDHFSQFEVPEAGPKSRVDGFRTRSENFADHLGLAESFRAFRNTMKKIHSVRQKLPGLDRFSPNQLFFVSFANMWCVSGSKEWLFDELEASIHTPAKFRVLGSLRNSNDFAREWGCPVGSYMNPSPKESLRCIMS